MLVLNYPHVSPSMEPRRLRKEEIWQVGEVARAQLFGAASRPKIDLGRLVTRSSRLAVNGLRFNAHWELGRAVTDDQGCAVLGAVEHDEGSPLAAMIYVNGEEIGERHDLARSTAAHELGHAVFDAPAWIKRAQDERRPGHVRPPRRFQQLAGTPDEPRAGCDWREWRANEFMGALLAPRALLHRHAHKRAAALRIPLVDGVGADGLPLINGCKAGFDAIETLAIELAELFGVSIAFMQVRLHKYRLIAST